MSDPTPDLQNLNLDDMPVTRSHTQASQRGVGRARREAGSSRINPIERTSSHGRFPACGLSRRRSHGTQEQVAAPGHRSPSQTNTAAASAFLVERVSHHGTYIDFHLLAVFPPVTRATVQIHSSPGRQPKAICNYTGHHVAHQPCFHISWLISTLYKVLQNPPVILKTDGTTIQAQIADIFPLIAQEIEESLRKRLNPYHRGGSREHEDSIEGPQLFADENSCRDDLADILTTFDIAMLPEEFRQVAQRDPIARDLQDCYIENNLRATIYRIAMRDRHLFQVLRAVVTPEVRATSYLTKQERRAQRSLHSLHDHARTGAIIRSMPNSVPECARDLRRIVHQVYEDREARLRGTFSKSAGKDLAAFMVTLVEEIVKRRDLDFYEHVEWQRVVPGNEQDRDRNIYKYLISDPPVSDSNTEQWMADLFVIDRFDSILRDQWGHLVRHWDAIRRDVQGSTSEGEHRAVAYVEKINDTLQATDDLSDDPISS